MRFYFDSSTFKASGSGAANVHQGAGKLLTIISTTAVGTAQSFTIYDSVSTSGTVLFTGTVTTASPLIIQFDPAYAPKFSSGLAINPGNCNVFLSYLA